MNWFEGGRRIRDLLLGAVALGGVGYVVLGDSPSVYFSTEFPGDPWKFTGDSCSYPNESRYLWRYAFKSGDQRSVLLCYRVNERGKIPYQEAPPPKDAPPPKINVTTIGSPPIPEPKWYFEGESFDARVTNYMATRTAEFRMTPALEAAARQGLRRLGWNAVWQRLKDTLLWVGGFAIVLWIITAMFGWIVRGFAGIPAGEDFRPTKQNVAGHS